MATLKYQLQPCKAMVRARLADRPGLASPQPNADSCSLKPKDASETTSGWSDEESLHFSLILLCGYTDLIRCYAMRISVSRITRHSSSGLERPSGGFSRDTARLYPLAKQDVDGRGKITRTAQETLSIRVLSRNHGRGRTKGS
jgi:hypothetical protein